MAVINVYRAVEVLQTKSISNFLVCLSLSPIKPGKDLAQASVALILQRKTHFLPGVLNIDIGISLCISLHKTADLFYCERCEPFTIINSCYSKAKAINILIQIVH